MLEQCPDLFGCETTLRASVEGVTYLGEVDFFFSAIEKLARLIQDGVRQAQGGLKFLRRFPACVSFYLVGRGITGYDSGDFWTMVNRELGIADSIGQYRLGAVFLKFLRDQGLYHTRIEGAPSYVSRILLHGGIPRSCRVGFYNGVVKHLLERGLVEAGRIGEEIGRLREREDTRNQLAIRCRNLRREVEHLESFIHLHERRAELAAQTADRAAWAGIPEYASFVAAAGQEQLLLDERLAELKERQNACLDVVRSFTAVDRTLLDVGPLIDDLAGNVERYQHALSRIPVITGEMEEYERVLGSTVRALFSRADDFGGNILAPLARAFVAAALGTEETSAAEDVVALVQARPDVVGLGAAAKTWCWRLLALRDAGRRLRQHEQALTAARSIVGAWQTALDRLSDRVGLSPAGSPPERIGRLAERMAEATARQEQAIRAADQLNREIRPALAAAGARRTRLDNEMAAAARWSALTAQVQEYAGELAAGLWPDGWDEAYAGVVSGLALPAVERAWHRFRDAGEACRQVEGRLAAIHGAAVRPPHELWLGALLTAGGAVLARSGVGYPVACGGIVLLAAACFRLVRRAKSREERRRAEMAELKAQESTLATCRQELAGLLAGLPVGWEETEPAGEEWIGQLADLQDALRERSALGDELRQLQTDLGEREVAVALAELAGAIRQWEERRARCLAITEGFTASDRLLVEKAGSLAELAAGLGVYAAGQQREELLLEQIEADREEIDSLVQQPLGWDGGSLGASRADFADQLVSYDRLPEALSEFVESLGTMERVHGQYRRRADELSLCQAVIAEWEEKQRKIAARTGFSGVGERTERLAVARTRAQDAQAAREVFREEVWPQLVEARSRKLGIAGAVAELEDDLKELGGGDLREGIHLVGEKKRALAELFRVEEKLRNDALSSWRWEEVLRRRGDKTAELAQTGISLKKVENEISSCHSFLNVVDEPVKRFVLCGGDWAIKWLYAAVALHRHYLRERVDLGPVFQGLPARVVQELDALVRSVREEEKPKRERAPEPVKGPKTGKRGAREGDRKKSLAEQFPAPELRLDGTLGELQLRLGGCRFRVHNNAAAPEIYVQVAGEDLAWRTEIKLSGYRGDGMVEVPWQDCPLRALAPAYLVTLHTGGIEHRWRVPFADAPYLLFTEKGRRLEPHRLAPQRAWLLYADSFVADPEKAIVSERSLLITGGNFRLALIDLRHEPVVYLAKGTKRLYEIRVAPGVAPSGPYLSDEETAPGVWTNDKLPVYVGDVPRLVVPLAGTEDPASWSILVERPDGAPGGLVGDIAGLGVEDGGRLVIFLDEERLLGRRPVGEYTVRLRHEDEGEYRFDLAIFPDLMFSFDQLLYFPRAGNEGRIKLNVVISASLEGNVQVEVKEPARLIGRDDDEVHIEVAAGCDTVDLELVSAGPGCRTAVSVEVPKVRWRMGTEEGLWRDDCAEVWHEDCLAPGSPGLEVVLPGHRPVPVERAKVCLEGRQEVYAKISKGILAFNLTGLADTVRAGADVQDLTLVLEDGRGNALPYGTGKLLAIRGSFRVEDFRYEVTQAGEGRMLKASWTDLGRPKSRAALLWRMDEPWAGPRRVPVAAGSSCLEFPLPAGRYLLNLAADENDPWGGEGLVAEFPQTMTNSAVIDIPETAMHAVVDECRWEGETSLFVAGMVPGPPVEMAVGLLGIAGGRSGAWWRKATTGANGRFRVSLRPPRFRPHWLGVVVGGAASVYRFELLPDPGGVWWPLGSPSARAGREGLGGGRLFVDCQDKRLDQPLLPVETGERFWQAWSRGDRTVGLSIKVGGVAKEVELTMGNSNEATMTLDALVCTDCGQIVPNQRVWDTEHYPKCKSFNTRPVPVGASLYWYWDTTSHLASVREKYALAGRDPLTLYDNLTRPVPGSVWSDRGNPGSDVNLDKLVAALWEREVALFVAANGGKPHEY